MARKKRGFLSNLILGSLGMGLLAYGLKKYRDLEDEDLISTKDYEDRLREDRDYVEIDLSENIDFFKRDLIENDSKADNLFRLFLDRVEEVSEIASKEFKIGDIEKLIPFESSGLDTRSSYNYSVMSMLGGQANRDYFIFLDRQDLRDIFTDEANSSSRNDNLWRDYGEESFTINPKYIREA